MSDTDAQIRRDIAPWLEASRRLGREVADGTTSAGAADEVVEIIANIAADKAPRWDKSGLRLRLVWEMRDTARSHWYALQRVKREQERELANVGAAAFRAGQNERGARLAIAEAARSMTPSPTIDQLDAALGLGRWRAKWGSK